MAKKNNKNGAKLLVWSGLMYLILGMLGLIFLHRLSSTLNIESNYIFTAAMVLILLGLKDIAIMPLFLKNKSDKNKTGKK